MSDRKYPSRRSVAKGAAWSSPVLVAGTFASQVAASTQCAPTATKRLTYSLGPLVAGTAVRSGLTGDIRPYAAGDENRISSFPQTLTVTSLASTGCTIPAGTVVAHVNVDVYNPAVSQPNNSFVVGGTGAGSSVQDSILDGYTVPFSTPSSLAPGASMVFALTYGLVRVPVVGPAPHQSVHPCDGE